MSHLDMWRVELCLVKGGRVFPQARVKVRNISFSDVLNGTGLGSVTLNSSDLVSGVFKPGETVIAFSRIGGHGASPLSPVVEFLGLAVDLTFNSTRTATFGLHSPARWLDRAAAAEQRTYTQVAQEDILVDAINSWVPGERRPGIYGRALTHTNLRDRTYLPGQRVGSMLANMSEVIQGPEFRTRYVWDPTYRTYRTNVEIAAPSFASGAGASLHDRNATISVRLSALDSANFAIASAELPTGNSWVGGPEVNAGGARATLLRTTFENEDSIMMATSPSIDTDISYGVVADRLEGALTSGPLAIPFVSASLGTVPDAQTVFGAGDTVSLRTEASGVRLSAPARVQQVDWTVEAGGGSRQLSLSISPDTQLEIVG